MPLNDSILNIYCDGGARGNPGPAASAFVVKDATGKTLHQQGFYLGIATNNIAEYTAVLKAVEWIIKFQPTSEITFFLDSLLVVNQLKGVFKIKEPNLKIENLKIKKLIENCSPRAGSRGKLQISNFIYVPREQNFFADKLVNQTLDSQ
ncbi:MAG: ribonuclease HI [Microgenomates group bacterium Gr01-1014_16]|nr:MAG: ribonuclease HI [Microgenomates group bacterium Gr01-1014_16]